MLGCATSKSNHRTSPNAKKNSSNIKVRSLANYIGTIPRLTIRGSAGNVQVFNSAVNTIQLDRRPLFVLDGVQVGRDFSQVLTYLNEDAYVTVEFLKISRATIRYGEEGRNGVLLINSRG